MWKEIKGTQGKPAEFKGKSGLNGKLVCSTSPAVYLGIPQGKVGVHIRKKPGKLKKIGRVQGKLKEVNGIQGKSEWIWKSSGEVKES